MKPLSLITLSLTFAVIFSAFATTATAAEVYKTVDAQGRVTYSDKPKDDTSVPIELKDSNNLPAPGPGLAPRPQPNTADEGPTSYQVAITSPENEHHVTPGTFDVAVQVNVEPNVARGHRMVLTVDGEVVEGMVIKNILRGTHQLVAEVFNQDGDSLGRSESVTVYVHRPSVKLPVKPPTKPTPKPSAK